MAVSFLGLTFGDDGTGFVKPTYAALREATGTYWRKLRNLPSLNLQPGSFFGDMLDIAVSVLDASMQGAVDAVAMAFFNQASGVSLDLLLSPVTTRLPAVASAARVYAYGTVGSTVPINAIVRTSTTAPAFTISTGITIPAIAVAEAWVFEVEDFAAGEQAGVTFTLTVAGTPFVFTAGGSDDSEDVRDYFVSAVNLTVMTQIAYLAGTLPGVEPTRWAGLVREESGSGPFTTLFTSTGAPSLTSIYTADQSPVTCSETGPIQAPAQSLRYGQSYAGIVGYVNVTAALVGRDQETDAQMRARHLITQRRGCGSPDAIRSAMLLPVDQGGAGASYCSVEYNSTNVTDAFGNVPHSVRVVVDSAADVATVGQMLWMVKAAGDDTNGSVPVAVTDAEGNAQVVSIDLLSTLYIWSDIEVAPGENWPNTGDPLSQVRSDVVDYINLLGGNGDVKVNDAPISNFPDGGPRGVANFRVRFGYSTDPAGLVPPITYLDYWPTPEPDASLASITITSRQVAETDITRVTATYI